jgi:hypothetical protein
VNIAQEELWGSSRKDNSLLLKTLVAKPLQKKLLRNDGRKRERSCGKRESGAQFLFLYFEIMVWILPR